MYSGSFNNMPASVQMIPRCLTGDTPMICTVPPWHYSDVHSVSNHQHFDCVLSLVGTHEWKHTRSASLAFVRGNHASSAEPIRIETAGFGDYCAYKSVHTHSQNILYFVVFVVFWYFTLTRQGYFTGTGVPIRLSQYQGNNLEGSHEPNDNHIK